MWRAIEYAELFGKGLAPEAGGVLDQAAGFVDVARAVWAERARLEAEAMQRGGSGRPPNAV